jgi:hypothetical protein
MARKLTQQEKDAHILMKNLVKKPTKLKAKDFVPGQIILYTYKAKYEKNPYDASPVVLILGRTRKYTYGINWNWIPRQLRKGLMDSILKVNKKNIENNKPLVVPKDLVMKIFRMGLPAFRKYINSRISPKGVVLPHNMYNKVIDLRAENFIGISAEDAWKIAVRKIKRNKKHTARKDKGYK